MTVVSCAIVAVSPLLLGAAIGGDPGSGGPVAATEKVEFARDVRPILSDNCFHCHGPDPATRKAGLRLDTPEGAAAALSTGGHAVVAGNTEESELLYRVAPLFEEDIMPPERSGKSLSAEEIETLTRWIRDGAAWDEHWSFRSPALPTPPSIDGYRTADPIDAFIAERLAEAGLEMQPEADAYSLLRRASLDLNGLPPSSDERAAFLAAIEEVGLDAAFEAAVDRLLASPRYGVHMARPWLDAARYADTHGLHLDNRRSMWPYRDWVVDALNKNTPFDEFTIAQLAGDLLPDPTQEDLVASGFNRCNPTSAEGGMITAEYLSIYAKDRADTTATVWLGLTLGCAQCHDHKFDPLSQRDYYGMYAFFNSLDEEATDRNIENPKPFMRTMVRSAALELDEMKAHEATLDAQLNASNPELEAAAASWIDRSRDEVNAHWKIVVPTRASSTDGVELVVDEELGEIMAKGENADVPIYEIELEFPEGAVNGLRLDALVPEGQKLPGRAVNENFVLTQFEVASAPLDGSSPFRRQEFREVVASHSQTNWPVEGIIDSDPKSGWAGLGLDGERSALLLPSRTIAYPSGVRLRVRLHFSDVHVQHTLARFRFAASTQANHAGGPGQSIWWRAHFPTEFASLLYDHAPISEEAIAEGLDLFAEAAPGVPWTPETQLAPDQTHLFETGLGVHYLVLRLASKEERTYQLRLGSDDGLMVWLRGEKIHENRSPRGVSLDQDLVPIKLLPGQNEVVVKVVNTGGASGFAWRLWDATEDSELQADQVLALMTAPDEGEEPDAEASSVEDALSVLARRKLDPQWDATFVERQTLQASIEKFREELPTTMISAELSKRRVAQLQMRGAYDQLGDVIEPATPAVLPPLPQDGPADRLALARWIVSRDNPLTARVWVNRAWQHFFGRGIVSTPEDFGSQGAWPTHPELLDWLAVTFMDEGWDMKAMHKRMVLSQSYRQSAARSQERDALDPEGALISHGPRFRLDGEVLRDQALYLAGLLDETTGGAGVFPYQPDGVWFAVGYSRSNTVRYAVGPEEDQKRRSLYTFWKRTAPPPNLTTFDAPMRDICTVQRERTNTPLQALVMLNDPTYVEAAKFIAARVLNNGAESMHVRAGHLFEHVVGRPASEGEVDALASLWTDLEAEYREDSESASALLDVGMLDLPAELASLDPATLAAGTLVASTLLNLDEVLTND